MKKLLALITVTLMTLTAFSQVTPQDTTKYIPKIKLTPITIEMESVKYKAFTFPQTRVLMKELTTLTYLNDILGIKNLEIKEYQSQLLDKDKQIGSLTQIDKNNQFIIGNQSTVIKNKDAVIHIKDNTIKKQQRNIIFGGVISIGIIGFLLFH